MKNRKREICTSGSVRDEDGQPPHLLGPRKFLHLAAGSTALDYPTRPVHLLEGFGAGSEPDIVIENRAGASSNIAAEAVVRAAPDGYTLFLITSANAVNATFFKLNFDLIHDLAPVASISRVPFVMEVHPSVPANTVAEFIAYAKANPGRINVESPGAGTSSHLAGELFKLMTGVNMVHIQYRGNGPALIDLLAGQVQVGFDTMPASIEYIRAGKLRALAVCTMTRSDALPDLPTVAKFVPGYESSGYFGFGAPAKTPTEIVDKLNQGINAGLADPKLKAQLADLGGIILRGSPGDFRTLIAEETEKWAKVIRAANIKPD